MRCRGIVHQEDILTDILVNHAALISKIIAIVLMVPGYPVHHFELIGNQVKEPVVLPLDSEWNKVSRKDKYIGCRPQGIGLEVFGILAEFQVKVGAVLNEH